MRHPSEWLSTKPEIDDYTSRPTRWWHWNREWCSDYDDYWYRLVVGDIAADGEHESGEPMGWVWEAAVRLWEDTGQFNPSMNDCWCGHAASAHANLDERCEAVVGKAGVFGPDGALISDQVYVDPKQFGCRCRKYGRKHYHDHSVTFIVWRWGVYLAWRGGAK